jgi:hypothetical protein
LHRRSNVTHRINTLGKRLLATLVAGGAVMGSGIIATGASASSLAFTQVPLNSASGVMSATLSDGTTYTGRYFQISQDTTLDSIRPLWGAWDSAWAGRSGWGYWNATPSPDFIRQYTGSTVANLVAPDGEHARCKFQLVHPAEGIAGGGTGQCQTPDGQTVDATFSST